MSRCKQLDYDGKFVYNQSDQFSSSRHIPWCPDTDPRYSSSHNPPENPIFLLGPILLSYLKHPNLAYKICLLGDTHKKLGKRCPYSVPVDAWIAEIVAEGIQLDLYLEMAFVTKDRTLEETTQTIEQDAKISYLRDVVLNFEPSCFHYSKSDCNINNTRIHYVDFRKLFADKYLVLRLINVLGELKYDVELLRNSDPSRQIYTVEYIKKVLQDNLPLLKKFTRRSQIKELLYDEFVAGKILKQLAHYPSDRQYIRDIILENFYTTEEQFYDEAPIITDFQYNSLLAFIKSKSVAKSSLEVILQPLHTVVWHYFVKTRFYGDIYLLARLFRSYVNVPGGTSRGSGRSERDGRDSTQSIIYLGANHIRYIKLVLEQIGFYTDYEDYNENQCLDISELNLFL